jgi:hypothetical protein
MAISLRWYLNNFIISNLIKMRKRKIFTRKRRMHSRKSVKRLRGGQGPLRLAILFVGRIKGYDQPIVKENLRKIKEKYNPTVFCSLNKTNKTDYIKGFCEFMGITDDRLHLEKTPQYSDYMNHVKMAETLHGKWGNGDAKQSAYSNFYHLQKVWKLFEPYKNNFDIVLYYRADIKSTEDLSLVFPVKDKTVYVPQTPANCDYGGLCMSFLYGNPETMKIFFNMIDYIEDMCKKQGVTYHAETLFKKHLENKQVVVERFPYAFEYTSARHEPNPVANMD